MGNICFPRFGANGSTSSKSFGKLSIHCVNSNDFLKMCPINGDKHCGTVTTAPQKRRSSKEAAKPAPRKWCSKNRSEKDAATTAQRKKRSVNGAACVCAFARARVCVRLRARVFMCLCARTYVCTTVASKERNIAGQCCRKDYVPWMRCVCIFASRATCRLLFHDSPGLCRLCRQVPLYYYALGP